MKMQIQRLKNHGWNRGTEDPILKLEMSAGVKKNNFLGMAGGGV